MKKIGFGTFLMGSLFDQSIHLSQNKHVHAVPIWYDKTCGRYICNSLLVFSQLRLFLDIESAFQQTYSTLYGYKLLMYQTFPHEVNVDLKEWW